MEGKGSHRNGDEDAGESENVKKDAGGGGKKGHGGDQKHGKESKKGGKADRQKGAPKAKDPQANWVKKGEADVSEEEPKPQERKGRGDKAKEKRDGTWKEGRPEGKKESWKERRGKQQESKHDADASGAGDPAAGGGRHRGGGGEANANADASSVLNGGALLSILKANVPSVTRYTREELLSIGQLPSSKVKPSTLCPIIDKENSTSPLLVKPKVDKVARGNRNRDGEEEEVDEDAAGASRRERRQQRGERNRRGESDEEEDAEKRRNRAKWTEEQTNNWKEPQQQPRGGARATGKGGRIEEELSRGLANDQWAMPQVQGHSEWDMPDAKSNGDLSAFTLGDIRQAERSFNKGMSMSDYKASLRADQRAQQPHLQQGAEASRGSGSKDRGSKERDGIFGGQGGFFVEEEEDVPHASRGFGKWFGRGAEAGGKGQDASDEDGADLWDMPPAQQPKGSMALPPSMGSQQGKSQPSSAVAPRSPQAHPMGLSSIESLLEESPSSTRMGDALKPSEALIAQLESPKDEGSNMLGKSILSMLGRTEPAAGEPGLAESSAITGQDPAKQGKLSVAELFNLAKGQELPPIPPMSNKQKEDGSASEESAEQKMQREVLKMASNFMWMAAAKAGPGAGAVPPGSRYPGYQPTAPYGAVPPSAFGMSRPGGPNPAAMMGRGNTPQDQLYAEAAYAQAQAMMGAGGGGYPGGPPTRGAPKGAQAAQAAAQASWQSSMGAGYPYPRGPGYGSQSYSGYPPDYSQLSRGAGAFDGSSAQGYGAQAAAMHGMYGGLGSTPEGLAAAPRSAEKGGGGRSGAYGQASSIGGPLPGAGAAAATDGAGGVGQKSAATQEANDEEAGCSQS